MLAQRNSPFTMSLQLTVLESMYIERDQVDSAELVEDLLDHFMRGGSVRRLPEPTGPIDHLLTAVGLDHCRVSVAGYRHPRSSLPCGFCAISTA